MQATATATHGDRKQSVAVLMARMAAGDAAAIFELYDEFGAAIAASVRRVLATRGAVGLPREEVDGIVIEVCTDLFERAASWSPDGGALPWVWAERRIGNLVDRALGQHADSLDVEHVADTLPAERWAAADEPDLLHVLRRAAERRPECALLADALGSVATERDRELFLEVGIQASLGDRSPAVTVGALLGMQPDAVRQQHRRVKRRLQQLAAQDTRFAPLAALPMVA